MDALSSIGSIFAKIPGIFSSGPGGTPPFLGGQSGSGIGNLLQLILGGLGVARNMGGMSTQDAAMKRAAAYQKQLMDIANNPAQLMARARALQQPLSTGLLESVGSDVQGQLQSRGLTASPAAATQIMSQTLAPYEQRQQELGLNAALQALGLPISATGAIPKFLPSDTSSLWRMFQPGAGAGGTPPWADPTSYGITIGGYGGGEGSTAQTGVDIPGYGDTINPFGPPSYN